MAYKIVLVCLLSSFVNTNFVPLYNPAHHYGVELQKALNTIELNTRQEQISDNVKMDVYYESLCPDSINFIVDQLYPTWKKLEKYLTIEFIPFGKALFSPDSSGGWDFECQHGPDECKRNMYQACFLDIHKYYDGKVETVNCIMSSSTLDIATEMCMGRMGLDPTAIKRVEACANTIWGQDYLYNMGVKTQALNPPLNFVPWITFNGDWKQTWQDGSIENLEQTLCSNFLQVVPECTTLNPFNLPIKWKLVK